MRSVNMHDAKTNLSRLVEQAAHGESFVIARAGKALVKVVAVDAPTGDDRRRLGFMEGEFDVPEDFDHMGAVEIEAMFGGQP